MYLDLAAASDVVTSFSGSEEYALELNTTTSFYQHPWVGPLHYVERHGVGCSACLGVRLVHHPWLDGPAGDGEQMASFIPPSRWSNRLMA